MKINRKDFYRKKRKGHKNQIKNTPLSILRFLRFKKFFSVSSVVKSYADCTMTRLTVGSRRSLSRSAAAIVTGPVNWNDT